MGNGSHEWDEFHEGVCARRCAGCLTVWIDEGSGGDAGFPGATFLKIWRPKPGGFWGKARWARWGLNPRPKDYESPALTAELQAPVRCAGRCEPPPLGGDRRHGGLWQARRRERPRLRDILELLSRLLATYILLFTFPLRSCWLNLREACEWFEPQRFSQLYPLKTATLRQEDPRHENRHP